MKKRFLIAAGFFLFGQPVLPAMADTPSTDKATNVDNDGKTSVPKRLSADKMDIILLNNLMSSKDPEQKALAVLVKFIDNESSIAGALSSCDNNEYKMFLACSRQILIHWKDIMGRELPTIATGDKDTEEVIQDIWISREDESRSVMQSTPQQCPNVIALSHKSAIWKTCVHPSWDDPNLQQDAPGQTLQ